MLSRHGCGAAAALFSDAFSRFTAIFSSAASSSAALSAAPSPVLQAETVDASLAYIRASVLDAVLRNAIPNI